LEFKRRALPDVAKSANFRLSHREEYSTSKREKQSSGMLIQEGLVFGVASSKPRK